MRYRLSFLALAVAACAADANPEASGLGEDLQIGDTGTGVHALHERLYQSGYFPNAELAREFSDWRAVVPESPAHLDDFDENTERAVAAFQRVAGLPATGVVDAATKHALEIPHCGVPESGGSHDEKWARWNVARFGAAVTYSVNTTGTPRGMGATFNTQIDTAMQTWQARSGYTLTRVASGGNIRVSWGTRKADVLADTSAPSGGVTNIVFASSNTNRVAGQPNTNFSWNFTGETAMNAFSVASVAVHEIGHALGLDHSTIGQPVMFYAIGAGQVRTALANDDVQGIHALRAGYSSITTPSGTTSVVAGLGGDIWVTGGSSDNNGSQILRRNPNTGAYGEHALGGRATMLAVESSGALWHINNGGDIYRAEGSAWVKKFPGSAASAIVANGTEVWHLSKAVTRGTREHDIYRFNGSGWEKAGGFATDIAIAKNPMNNGIEVWHINEAGEVYRQVPGFAARRASDPPGGACGISAGQDGIVYALQCPLNPNGMPIFMYNEQLNRIETTPGIEGDQQVAPTGAGWVQVEGTARDITSVQSNARIFHLGTDGGLWMSR